MDSHHLYAQSLAILCKIPSFCFHQERRLIENPCANGYSLHNPTRRCPWTNEPLNRHMTYVENRNTREILIRYLGEEAYKRYHDTDFKK
jgi:hypothetical protein